jgi:hypothetical protein
VAPLPLKAALRRGLVLVVANWQVVLIDLAASAFAQAALIVPIVGGVLMVASLVGSDIGPHFADGLLPAAEAVLDSLATSPAALAAFLSATAIMAVGSDVVLLIIKGGTLSVLVAADEMAGELGRRVIGETELTAARSFSADRLVAGAREFHRPMIALAFLRAASFVLVALLYLLLVASAVTAGPTEWPAAWSAALLAATSAGIVVVSGINLVTDLLRVAIVSDHAGLREAAERVWRFVVVDARQVIGIVSVIAGVEIVASSVAVLAAAGLAPVAYLPVVSLAVLPLQVAFWIVRGLVFELASLSSVAACQTQYRRFSSGRFERRAWTLSERPVPRDSRVREDGPES